MSKTVIFDMDGTLADTSIGIVNCYRYALSELDLPSPSSDDVLIDLIGGPLVSNFMRGFGLSEKDAVIATKIYRERYSEIGYSEAKLYPGIKNLLELLKSQGYLMGIATLKAERFATEMLKRFGISEYFDSVCGVTDSDISKGKLIARCLDELGIESSDAVYIGDSENDAIGASQNGINFIAVTYGFGFDKNSCYKEYNVVYISDDVESLMSYFNSKLTFAESD